MKPTTTILTAIGTLLMLAACQTEQLPTDGSPFAPGEERPLIIRPVVSSAIATRSAAGATTRATRATRATGVPVTLTGGGVLALTLSKSTTEGAPTQTAVYDVAAAAGAEAPAPLAYNHQATIDTLLARGTSAEEAAARACALYVTNAGTYPLAAVGTALRATTTVTTTPVPFALHVRRAATDDAIEVKADGTTNLPLHIASAGVMLRMKYYGEAQEGKPGIVIHSVRCLPTGETAPREPASPEAATATASRVMTTTATDADGIATDHVLFGTLTPNQELTKGYVLAEINATVTTVTDVTTGATTTEAKVFSIILPRSVTPQAGQLLTYTVHVNHTLASIEGEVKISEFTPGNGSGGEDIGIGTTVTADGLAKLDTKIFNAKHPVWVITGGGTTETDTEVYNNVKAALDALPEGTNSIELTMTGVMTIPVEAFEDYVALKTVHLPEVTSIGDNAFNNCTALTTVSLPKATSTIGQQAFSGCTALATISLPEATGIGDKAFYNCTSLKTLTLPAVTSIGTYAFSNCNALTHLELTAADDIELGTGAFHDFTNSTACRLVLNPDKKADDGKQWGGLTWLSITYAEPAAPAPAQ